MNINLTNPNREYSSWLDRTNLFFGFIIIFFFSYTSQVLGQGETACTATDLWLQGTHSKNANGPSTGNGAVNSCFSNGNATHADWYKVTIHGNGKLTVKSCLAGVDTRLSIFTGTCNNLTCFATSDDDCPINQFSYNWASSLELDVTDGTTYYIQWDNRWSSSAFTWYFDYTIGNNVPCDAELLECGSNVIGNFAGSSNTYFGTQSCGFQSMPGDVFYKVNALAGVEYTVKLQGPGLTGLLTAYSTTGSGDCDSFTNEIGCANLGYINVVVPLSFTRPIDEEILIRVSYHFDFSQIDNFHVGLTCSPSPNDECINAINIPVDGPPISGDNTGATVSNNLVVACGNYGDTDTDADVWYKFTAPSLGKIKIETFNDPTFKGLNDSQIQVFQSCGGPSLFCDEDGGNGYMSKIVIPCDAYIKNATYYIQVDGWNTSRGSFKISVTTTYCDAPPNDFCSSATALSINNSGDCAGNQTLGTTSGASVAYPTVNACESGSPDVYYEFNSEENSEVIINLNAITATDLVLSAFESSCNSQGLFCAIGTNLSLLRSVTPYTTYYVRVHSLQTNQTGTFSICIEKVAPTIATVNGTIAGWNTSCATRNVKVSLQNKSTLTTYVVNTTLTTSGTFVANSVDIPAGSYNILVKVQGALAVLKQNVVLNSGANSLSAGPIVLGDANNNNAINALDLSLFSASFGTSLGSPGFNYLVDLNCDGFINFFDFSILSAGFNKTGATFPPL